MEVITWSCCLALRKFSWKADEGGHPIPPLQESSLPPLPLAGEPASAGSVEMPLRMSLLWLSTRIRFPVSSECPLSS